MRNSNVNTIANSNIPEIISIDIILFLLNSPLALNEILINGGLLTASVALFTIFLIQLRTNLVKKEIIARLALAESNKQLAIKNEIIEEKNKDILDSIRYAKRIQTSLMPTEKYIERILSDKHKSGNA